MDRRMLLKATAAGLVHPRALLSIGPALIQQGNRRLKDITPAELIELVAWAEIDLEDLTTVEEAADDRGRPIASLHPQYYFEWSEEKSGICPREWIWFRYRWCGDTDEYPEWEEVDGLIEIGDVRIHTGHSIASPVELVKWFLCHGFGVW